MKTDHLLKALLVVLLLAAGAWVAMNTEWVDVDTPTPPKGEALTNELYTTQQLVRQLGAKVVRPEGLAKMPPKGATLFLSAWHWDLFPERERQLRTWIEQGGHLVIEADMLDNERLQAWLPINLVEEHEEQDEASAPAASSPKAPRKPAPECEQVAEPEGIRPAYPDGQGYKLCGGHGYQEVQTRQPPVWAIEGRLGYDMIRQAVGQGSVTVFTTSTLLRNKRVLDGDNALLAMAVLQVRRGGEVWFVAEEGRPPLLAWVWAQGWVAVLLGLLAIGAALWRGAVRFGPLMAQAVPGRRSMAEQVTGTAQFLRQRGADALHAAQVRALDETAKQHLRDYLRLDRQARAQALAKATGIDAQTLARALDRSLKRSSRELPPTLDVLETARRRLSQPPSSRR
jgi:hypothetical protein